MGIDRYRLLYKITRFPVLRSFLPLAKAIVRPLLNLQLSLFMGRVTYFMMGTVTNKNCDFMKERAFVQAYKAAMNQQYMPDTDIWRYHINHWAVRQALKLEGDFVECGVNRGSTAMSNIVYIDFGSITGRKYYLFDTFNGLDEHVSTPDEYDRLKGTYPDCYRFVVESFKKYPNVQIVRGTVPGTLPTVEIEKVSYLSLDMNCAFAERAAMKYFWPMLVTGGIIVLDDYGWPMCESQKQVADDFAASVGAMILALPNGQGVIVK